MAQEINALRRVQGLLHEDEKKSALMWEAPRGFPAFSLVIGALDLSFCLSRFEIAGSRFAFILTKDNPFYEGGADKRWLNSLYLYAYDMPHNPKFASVGEAFAYHTRGKRNRMRLIWQTRPISFELTSWDESQPWVVVVNGVFYGDLRHVWKP